MNEASSQVNIEPVTLGSIQFDRALHVLEELACMSRANVPWNRGLAALSRSEDRQLAELAKHLSAELEKGKSPFELIRAFEPYASRPLLSLLQIAHSAEQPGDVLLGLVRVLQVERVRRQRWRRAGLYTAGAIVTAASVLGLSLYAATSETLFQTYQLSGSENEFDQIHPATYWYLPMILGFVAPTVFVLCLCLVKGLRPQHWGRLGWFVELMVLQIKRQVPLTEACERAGKVALPETEQQEALGWVEAWRSGRKADASDSPLDVVRWTLESQTTDVKGLLFSLERYSQTFTSRAHRLATRWERVLPGLIICSTVLGLIISYVLLVIYPVYSLVIE